jgi:peptidyl-tRNA hydrolase, PTH2 family
MVLIVRGELRLTAGKVAVQAAHAAVQLARRAEKAAPAALAAWWAEGQMKVALSVETLPEMEAIERRARGAGLLTAWVEDAGFTEVPPGTRTCLGIGPAPAAAVDPITGDLPLL